MSRVPDCIERTSREQPDTEAPEDSAQALWHWLAVGLLVFCWIAEAAMCADRGF